MSRSTIAITAISVVVIVTLGGVAAVLYYEHKGKRPASKVTLSESGSSLLYPVFNAWAGNYTSATITTISSGSGARISSTLQCTVIIGASDAFMPYSLAAKNPWAMSIPIMISYQYIAYNIPDDAVSAHRT